MVNEIIEYQASNGLKDDGVLGDKSLKSLRDNEKEPFKTDYPEYNYKENDSEDNPSTTIGLIGKQTPSKASIILTGVTNCDTQSTHEIPNIGKETFDAIVSCLDIKTDPEKKTVVAIRGAYLQGNTVMQSDSAYRYMCYFYGHGTKEDGRHFSTRYQSNSQPGSEFDDIFITLWTESGQYHAQARKGSVDPNEMYAQGTSHLLDNPYTYTLGRHSTTHFDHMKGIIEACKENPSIVDTLNIEFEIQKPTSKKNIT